MKWTIALVAAAMLAACAKVEEVKPLEAEPVTAETIAQPDAVEYTPLPIILVRQDEGEVIENPFHPVDLLLSKSGSEGMLSVYQFELPPKSAGSPPHVHNLDDEYFIVLSGTLSIMIGELVIRVGEGDFVAMTRGHTHMFWNADDEPVKMIMATTGGTFDAFIAEAAPRLAAAKPSTPEEAGAVINALAAENDITITMDKLPEEAAPFYEQ